MTEDRYIDVGVAIVAIVVIILKIVGIIKISWLWLLSPLWIPLVIGLIGCIGITIICIIINLFKKEK